MKNETKKILQDQGINLERNIQEQILTRQGYRKIPSQIEGRDVWGKPLGTGIISCQYHQDKNLYEFFNAFVGIDGKTHVFSSKMIDPDPESFQHSICFYEGYNTRPAITNRFQNDFGFFSKEEAFENIL